MELITTEPPPAFVTATTMNTGFTNNFNTNGSSSSGGNAIRPMYLSPLLSNQDFIMAQQQQQQLQAASGGNQMPAPISSESSLNSSGRSSANASVSSHVSTSSPVPRAPTTAMTGASAASGLTQLPTGGLSFGGAPSGGSSSQQLLQPSQRALPSVPQVSTLQSSSLPAYSAAADQSIALASTAAVTNNPIILNTTAPDIITQGVNPITAAAAAQALLPGGSVPEFLYQLTKMLTDPNREIIEWSTHSGNGRIEVHNPSRLEKEVLGRYFRHSKYSSFQRQLNYFGFRKIAGKGKMSPCSYVNDAATTDIRCLLLMKRKNSKEKERELREAALATGEDVSSGNGVDGSGVSAADSSSINTRGMNTRSKKRRVNPGDDIQPATVRPMFNTAPSQPTSSAATVSLSASHASAVATGQVDYQRPVQANTNNEVFNSMAANIARNIRQQSGSSQHPTAVSLAASRGDLAGANNKSSADYGFKVAVGKGVRHQLNGYLRSNMTGSSTATSSSSASAMTGRQNTLPTNASTTSSYLSHPSSKLASSTPAPLQFLDPSELGMSLENSLSQLKDNFALATAATTADGGSTSGVASGAQVGGASAAVSVANSSSASSSASTATSATSTSSINNNGSQQQQQANANNNVKYAPSALTRRVSSTTFLGGMLSRDDSLINLAMLPTLDSVNGGTSSDGSGASGNVDLSGGIFSRNDSLMNLAAAVEAVSNGTATTAAATAAAGGANGSTAVQTSDNGDTFGFIDFQS